MPAKTVSRMLPNGTIFEIYQGDLTVESVDAIVNAANSKLMHGGGIAAAIVSRGGHVIQRESNNWVEKFGEVGHDSPAITSSGSLNCQNVIHAVGPIMGEGDEDEKLRQAVQSSLFLADEHNLKSIAFPAISTGIFGFPKDRAARVMFDTIWRYFSEQTTSEIELVRIILYDEPTLKVFITIFEDWIAAWDVQK